MTYTPRYTYIIPVYNEEAVLPFLFNELKIFLDKEPLKGRTEIVMVDDGSRDSSWAMVAGLASADGRFTGVKLSRNFGHQFALTAGYAVARGEAVICMDAALQDPPAVTLDFIRKWEEGCDIVYGIRSARKGENFFKLF